MAQKTRWDALEAYLVTYVAKRNKLHQGYTQCRQLGECSSRRVCKCGSTLCLDADRLGPPESCLPLSYVEDLEAALFRWQQREVALQQLLQQIEQLQRLVASHERLRAEDRRKHEESVTALTERVEMLQQELARLDPDESRITEARDQHEELVELLKERAASHGVQQQLLLEAQQLLQQVASSVQQPMDTIRSRDSGRGPPPALSLEEVSAVAMAAYEAKTSEEAAAADPSRSRPRLSLVEAVENVLTIRLSTDDKVQRSLAGVARTLQILQRQHQQRLHEELPESPLLRRVLRFGRFLGVCTLEKFLPRPCLNVFLFVWRRVQHIPFYSPRKDTHASPAAAKGALYVPTNRPATAAPAAAQSSMVGKTSGVLERPPIHHSSCSRATSGNCFLHAVTLFVLAADALAGAKETAAAALLTGFASRVRIWGGEGTAGEVCGPRYHKTPSPSHTPRQLASSGAATAAATAAAASGIETDRGKARLLLCGLLHCRLQQGKLKTLQRHLSLVEADTHRWMDRSEKPPPKPNPLLTAAQVQAILREAALPLPPAVWQPLLNGESHPLLHASALLPVGPSSGTTPRPEGLQFVELQHLPEPPLLVMETEDFYDVVLEACEADFAYGP
ncbi:uncharacterized protein LOC34618068 [Cyclospora cayetanensis]|uniref:Uncharacterized protein LOC34618068 n=1 Tax=Cyclospora cayetanensis TaxID=88456 RepID=A0A6P6RSA3_9EIME|nr:uncharacterized protein LOC34618068 [Cyclospora cayetanensis]